jgi:alpha-L-rhamnosidase
MADHFELETTIPSNTSATVYLPAHAASDITESGRELNQSQGVKFLRMVGDRAILAVESGTYHFNSKQ